MNCKKRIMNNTEAFCNLEMCRALMLFDPITGEDSTYESLNRDNQGLYDACGIAMEALRNIHEQDEGRLVMLPCKPKDIVYFIGYDFSKCSAYGEKYDEESCQGCCTACDSKRSYPIHTTMAEDLRWILLRYFDFGKTYFTTLEAAQAAAELRSMNEGL